MTQFSMWTRRLAEHPLFPFLGGILAFLATLSCVVAFVPILCFLVVINRRRCPSLVTLSALGSAAGAALLAYLLGRYGYPVVSEYLTPLIGTRHWQGAIRWVSHYGFVALTAIAALPMSHTPALILGALLGMPPVEVFASFLIGKGVKYAITATVTAVLLDHVPIPRHGAPPDVPH